MVRLWIACLCTILSSATVHALDGAEGGWKIYQSDQFGFELSYPTDMEYKAFLDGSSGELRDRNGNVLVDFEVWPPDMCPPQPASTTAQDVGIERAKIVTQADGPDGSSYCGDPVTVRERKSLHGNTIYELELTCLRETYPTSDDDEADNDAQRDSRTADTKPIITTEGKKGPTYFVDISQPWRKRVLLADPVGYNPTNQNAKHKIDPAIIRKILATIKTLPVKKSEGICIEELRNHPLTGVSPR